MRAHLRAFLLRTKSSVNVVENGLNWSRPPDPARNAKSVIILTISLPVIGVGLSRIPFFFSCRFFFFSLEHF